MERFVKGDLVILPFPFSDLTFSKKRPALIIANAKEDLILLQITSKDKEDKYCINLKHKKLKVESYIRINKIFTADKSLIIYKIGELNKDKLKHVENELIKLIRK